ncbi:MAG: NAD-binding protein, partial [Acidimicrobiia bacterium]|nr:NAD-binding protein [Acidimicrobiia bacterium]
GTGMNGRGAVEIIVAEIAFSEGLISVDVFSLLVFMAIFTTAADPLLLTRSVRWLSKHQPLVKDSRSGVVILGAGPTALRMALALESGGAKVTVIDSNASRCEFAEDSGFEAICGNVLETATLELAGVKSASLFLAVTSNTEVNVLAAQMASERYEVPRVHVVMAHGQPQSLYQILSAAGVHLLFGRSTDLTLWDAASDEGRVQEARYVVSDPTDLLEHGSGYESDDAELRSLPLLVKTGSKVAPYGTAIALERGSEIIALTRAVPATYNVEFEIDKAIPTWPGWPTEG